MPLPVGADSSHALPAPPPAPRAASIPLALGLAVGGALAILVLLVATPDTERTHVLAATAVAALAGFAASTIGVFGGVLVPGLLLLDVDPRFAAPLSLMLQVVAVPLGAASHYRLGNVRRPIAVPLIVGGAIGSAIGALLASSVPSHLAGRLVAIVIVVVGVIVLLTLRAQARSVPTPPEGHPAARVTLIGLVAGGASGISGTGWGPIGVKLLLLSGVETRFAIGSSLVGRVFMAISAVAVYALSAGATTGVRAEWALVAPLLIASIASMLPGALVVSRLGRTRMAAIVAVLSIVLALPTVVE
jgi:uncharacterized protein